MVNVITWARKKKMSHGDVTSAFEQTVGNNCKKTVAQKNHAVTSHTCQCKYVKSFTVYGVFFLKHGKTIPSIALAEGKKHFLRFKRTDVFA